MLFDLKNSGGAWEMILNAATIGLHLVCATFIGLAIGYYLENWLCDIGWCYKPWVMLFWLVAGIGAGFKNMYLEVRQIQKKEDERNSFGTNGEETENRNGKSEHGNDQD